MRIPPKVKKFDFFVKGEKILTRNLNITDNITEEEEYVVGLDDPLFRDVIRDGQTLACDLTEGTDASYHLKAVITNQPPREYERQEFNENDIEFDNWCWANLKNETNSKYIYSKFINKWAITGFPSSGDANARGTIAISGKTDIVRELKGFGITQRKMELTLLDSFWKGTFGTTPPLPAELPKDRLFGLKIVVVGDLSATVSGTGSISSIKCTAFKVSNKKYKITSSVDDDTLTLTAEGDYSAVKTGIEADDVVTDLIPGLEITIKSALSSGEQTVRTSIASLGSIPVTPVNVKSNGNLELSVSEVLNAGIKLPQFAFLVYAYNPDLTDVGVYPVLKVDSLFD